MYFIAKGECSVHIIDEKKRAHRDHKILRVGDYFGEISMIYGCKRSATVTSRKYSTLARLEKEQFKEIATEYPEILEILKKDGIYKYSDRMKKFMLKTIERVDYF
jgi:CRP-like cAMP-binding protein